MSRVVLSSRLRKHANNDSVKSGKLRHPLERVPQNSLLGKGSRIERSRRRRLFQKPLQFFTSKMSEGGTNFLKTGKRGRVGYEVRKRVNKCAPKTGEAPQHRPRTTQLWESPVYGRSQPAQSPLDAKSFSAPQWFGSYQCMAAPSPHVTFWH